jgi:hypothetical protein
MSQISPPIRILLVCAVAFLAAWMLFLRPSSDAGAPAADAPTPAASTPPVEAGGEQAGSLAGKAVEQANEATAAQDARAEQLAGGAGETAAPSATSATAVTPAAATTKTGAPADAALPTREALATVPADVRRAIRKRQIIVLGVVSPKGADDRLVRRSLTDVDKLHGRVFVRSVPVERVARFGLITRGADVTQTPSVVVVDFALRATTLAGWVDTATIDQAVVDGIRYSGELYTDPYLRQVARQCTQTFPDMRLLEPESGRQYSRAIGRYGTLVTEIKTGIAGLSTPAKWHSFSRGVRADMTALAATTASWSAALGSNPTFAQAIAAHKRYLPAANRSVDRLNKRFDAHDVISCGTRG